MSAHDDAVNADNPVAWWRCDETTPPPAPPNTALNDSADSHDGSLQPNSSGGLIQGIAGPILTDSVSLGMSGGIARIPGTGGVNGTDLQLDGDQTWEVWFKHVSVPGPSGVAATISTFINRGGDTTGTYLSTGQRSTGLFADQLYWSLLFRVGGSNVVSVVKSCDIPRDPDRWHHGAGVRKANEQWLYLDGWLVDYTDQCPTGAVNEGQSDFPWRLGYITNAVFGLVSRSQGQAHAILYDKALTQAQLRAHIIAALGSLPDNPCGETPTITVGCPNAEGAVGQPYSSEVTVTGGTAPYTFAVISGALPDGLSLNTNTGAITGTPTSAATFNFVIRATDSDLLTGQTSGCSIVIDDAPPTPPGGGGTTVFTFDSDTHGGSDEGLGMNWFIVLQLSDSGIETRDKVVKAYRVTGKITDGKIKGYGYGPQQNISVSDLEKGINYRVLVPLQDSTEVQQSKRYQVNLPNSMMHTVRIEGIWDGRGERDRVDEILIELAQQGIRR